MNAYDRDVRQPSQRLCILQGLAKEPDGRLNEHDLGHWLDLMGHRMARADVRVRVRELEALDAVRVQMLGPVLVAELSARGEDHVERRGGPLDGVATPPRI
jgi:hypothetical protein